MFLFVPFRYNFSGSEHYFHQFIVCFLSVHILTKTEADAGPRTVKDLI
jgi:hypothetical protein